MSETPLEVQRASKSDELMKNGCGRSPCTHDLNLETRMIRRWMIAVAMTCLWVLPASAAPLPNPLHEAARVCDVARTKALLRGGANVNAKKLAGTTPLHWAVSSGCEKATKALLKAGAKVNARDTLFPSTPLHWAAQNGKLATLNILLDAGANIEARDKLGNTPLHDAAYYKSHFSTTVIKALLDRGARVNTKNKAGATPLHLAARNGHAAAVKVLLKVGAKVNAGITPFDWARQGMKETQRSIKPFQEVIRILKAHGARE